MAVSGNHTGWRLDKSNSRLDFYYQGTREGDIATDLTTAITSGTTLTSATGVSVTTGNSTTVAGDNRITVGNVRLGAVEAFATTEPTSALVMKAGTAPSGAVATSGAVFTDGTTVKKIIAAGTASNIQT